LKDRIIGAKNITNLKEKLIERFGSLDGITASRRSSNGGFQYVKLEDGGAVYPDLSLEKPAVVNDGETIKVPEFEIKKIKQDLYIKSDKVTSSSDAVNIFREIWNPDTINAFEQAYVLYLNKNNKVIGILNVK